METRYNNRASSTLAKSASSETTKRVKVQTGQPTEDDYKLPVCDVEKERRNFPGCEDYENKLPLWDMSGTTETDSKSDPKQGGYTKIYSGREGVAFKGGRQLGIGAMGATRG